jgi:SP family general alpha glucoside:H+ symporter-like MFS transporter
MKELTDIALDQELLRIGHEVVAKQKLEGFRTAWRNHWRAAVWSLFISFALWMEGFDNSLVCLVQRGLY